MKKDYLDKKVSYNGKQYDVQGYHSCVFCDAVLLEGEWVTIDKVEPVEDAKTKE